MPDTAWDDFFDEPGFGLGPRAQPPMQQERESFEPA